MTAVRNSALSSNLAISFVRSMLSSASTNEILECGVKGVQPARSFWSSTIPWSKDNLCSREYKASRALMYWQVGSHGTDAIDVDVDADTATLSPGCNSSSKRTVADSEAETADERGTISSIPQRIRPNRERTRKYDVNPRDAGRLIKRFQQGYTSFLIQKVTQSTE